MSRDRLTPPTVINPLEGDEDLAQLVEYDRDTARLASESLAVAENQLRETHPVRVLKRAGLRRIARVQRETLNALGAQLRPLPPSLLSRSGRLLLSAGTSLGESLVDFVDWHFVKLTWLVGTVLTVGLIVVFLGWAADASRYEPPSPREQGRAQREGMSQLLRSQQRYAASHRGVYASTLAQLEEITPPGEPHYSLNQLQGELDILLLPDGYDAIAKQGETVFHLRVREGKTVRASCRAPQVQGCREGKWTPHAFLPERHSEK